jgi:hypothetical protein
MARPKQATKAPERISPTEALRLLLPVMSAHYAAKRLTDAVHANECRLWEGGRLMRPEIAVMTLVIVARVDKDGRWQAVVEGRGDIYWRTEIFTFDVDEVKALLPRAEAAEPQFRKRGPPPTRNWTERAAFEIGRIIGKENRVPSAPEMCQWCENTLKFQPDERDMRRLIARVIK